jgi:hypothetical protein
MSRTWVCEVIIPAALALFTAPIRDQRIAKEPWATHFAPVAGISLHTVATLQNAEFRDGTASGKIVALNWMRTGATSNGH